MNRLLLILLAALCCGTSLAQRTTRTRLRPSPEAVAPDKNRHTTVYDTLAVGTDTCLLAFSGYEKTLSSNKETFFVTNRTDSFIDRLEIEIIYLDMKRRTLDTRRVDLDTSLPAGATRRFDIRSWDPQKVFYYHLSPVPRASQATPYRVDIRLVNALKKRH